MSGERWEDFLQGFGERDDSEEEGSDEEEAAFVRKLAADPFGWLDEEVAERQNVAGGADEVRRQYFRGRSRRR
jgi:hypothetical protein